VVWVLSCALALLSAASGTAGTSPWRPGRPETVTASSGVFDPFVDGSSYEVGSELRFAPRRFRFLPASLPGVIPAAGMVAGVHGSLYAYGGFRFDFPFGRRWTFSPGWAVGLYDRSPRFDLGGPLEFRTSLELAWRLPDGIRVGVCLYHLSNGGLFARNPGSEALVLTYSAGL
jgi:hypothetical protein